MLFLKEEFSNRNQSCRTWYYHVSGGEGEEGSQRGQAEGRGRAGYEHQVDRGDRPAHASYAVRGSLYLGNLQCVQQSQHRPRFLQPWRVGGTIIVVSSQIFCLLISRSLVVWSVSILCTHVIIQVCRANYLPVLYAV